MKKSAVRIAGNLEGHCYVHLFGDPTKTLLLANIDVRTSGMHQFPAQIHKPYRHYFMTRRYETQTQLSIQD